MKDFEEYSNYLEHEEVTVPALREEPVLISELSAAAYMELNEHREKIKDGETDYELPSIAIRHCVPEFRGKDPIAIMSVEALTGLAEKIFVLSGWRLTDEGIREPEKNSEGDPSASSSTG